MINKLKGAYKNETGRTAINTLLIYAQRFLTAGIALITTPIILNALGVESYGLYTLSIGFVGMLSFLNWSLSSSTQRYIGVAIGAGDTGQLKKIFSTAFSIHLVYGILLLFIISIIGYYYAGDILQIPPDKIDAAKYVLIIVGFITFMSVLTIPLLGVLRANENFAAISAVGVTESILKLVIAVSLLLFTGNRLIFYALLLLMISVIVFIIYFFVINKNYHDVKFTLRYFDKILVKEMGSFLSWSLLGALAIMSRNQGVQVLINMFFGVVKNAAYGIAMQVSAAMSILAQGIGGSLSPKIIKSAGAGDHVKMIYLMRTMSKFSIFSISIVAIPVFFQCESILKIWLQTVPDSTVIYVRLIIIFGQLQLLSAGIQTVFDALGKVKAYNLWVSIILILNLPVSYLFFKLGYPSYSILIVGMVLELVSLTVRLQLLKQYTAFSVSEFFFDSVFRVALPTVATCALLYVLTLFKVNMYIELILSFILTILIYPVIIYSFSLEKKQKEMFVDFTEKFIKFKK